MLDRNVFITLQFCLDLGAGQKKQKKLLGICPGCWRTCTWQLPTFSRPWLLNLDYMEPLTAFAISSSFVTILFFMASLFFFAKWSLSHTPHLCAWCSKRCRSLQNGLQNTSPAFPWSWLAQPLAKCLGHLSPPIPPRVCNMKIRIMFVQAVPVY